MTKKFISNGSYGIVNEISKEICSKTLKLYCNDGMIEESTIKEIHFYTCVKHPNMPLLHSIKFNDDYTVDIFMEKCDTTLVFFINTNTFLYRLDFFSSIFSKLISFVNILHKNNIIHGDITISNIIFKKDVPKLIDFGTSFKIDDSTDTQKIYTTYLFSSPESLLNNEFTLKNDIWSLGIVMYYYIFKIFPIKNISRYSPLSIFSKEYLKNYYSENKEDIIIKDCKYLNKNIIVIIEGCLKFDPNERISLEEIIKLLDPEFIYEHKEFDWCYDKIESHKRKRSENHKICTPKTILKILKNKFIKDETFQALSYDKDTIVFLKQIYETKSNV